MSADSKSTMPTNPGAPPTLSPTPVPPPLAPIVSKQSPALISPTLPPPPKPAPLADSPQAPLPPPQGGLPTPVSVSPQSSTQPTPPIIDSIPPILKKRSLMKTIIVILSVTIIGGLIGLLIAAFRDRTDIDKSLPLNEALDQTVIPLDQPEEPLTASDCTDLPEKLASCTPYTCQFTPNQSETSVKRIVNTTETGDCSFSEESTTSLTCTLSPEHRAVMALYYANQLDIDSFGTTEPSEYVISGKTVTDPIQELLDLGVCSVAQP